MASKNSDEQTEYLKSVNGTDAVDKYTCLNCRNLAMPLTVANCEHIFCSYCFPEIFGNINCPGCGNIRITEVRKHALYEEEIQNLKVECQNKQYECKKNILLRDYQEHLETKCQLNPNTVFQKVHKGQKSCKTSAEMEGYMQKIELAINEIKEKIDRNANEIDNFKNSLTMRAEAEQGFGQELNTISRVEMYPDLYNNRTTKSKIESSCEKDEESNQVVAIDNLDSGKTAATAWCDDRDRVKISKEVKKIIKISDEMKAIANDVEKLKNRQLTEADDRKEIRQKRQIFEKEIAHKLQAIEEKLSILCTKTSENTKSQMENISADQDMGLELQGCPTFDSDDTFGKYPVFIWKISGFKKLWEANKYTFKTIATSDIFHNTEFGLKFQALLQTHDTLDLGMSLDSYKCNTSNFFARKSTLIDQSDRVVKNHVQYINKPKFSINSAEDFPYFNTLAPEGLLQKDYSAYVRDDSVIVKISMIPLALIYKSVASGNGVQLWRIDNYSKKKQEEINCTRRHMTSNSFYTSPQGYRVQAHFFLNGNNKTVSDSLSMYIEFVLGEFDRFLPCPFSGKAKFVLLDRSESPDKQHVSREIQFYYTDKSNWIGRDDFIPQNIVEKSMYLKDDSLLFKIMVKLY